jgi:hypothetical protein
MQSNVHFVADRLYEALKDNVGMGGFVMGPKDSVSIDGTFDLSIIAAVLLEKMDPTFRTPDKSPKGSPRES